MPSLCSRRAFLASLMASTATAACAKAPETSPRPTARPLKGRAGTAPEAEALIAAAQLGGEVAFLVADAATGKVLEGRAAGQPMPPASTAKVLTTLFAFERLGQDYRFTTRVLADGSLAGGRLNGDLVLAGGGDPTLDTEGLAGLAAALKARGLREATGRLRYYGGALPYQRQIAAGQPDHLGYNPAVSGLNLNFNRVYFEWKKQGAGYAVSMDARSDKRRPAVRSATMEIADRAAPLYTWRDGGEREHWTVMRRALGKDGGRWLPVRHPDRYAAEVLRGLARAEGVAVGPEAPAARLPGGPALAIRQSAPLLGIAREMLEYSTNITAEVLGLTASGAATLPASAAVLNGYAASRFGAGGIRLVDHSGLGEASRVTAEDMVAVLVGSGPKGPLMPILKPIPIRDARGRPVKDHPLKIRAKTGTLNFVSALTGYLVAPGGRVLAFAILTGDVRRRAKLAEDDQDRPQGASAWNARSKALQQALLERWGRVYSA
jgi:D-alanyl-D-alanine carboxypeptidase/D-alanyl-D-alanine-endopeptidase (penicillin-binding protein 4)